MAGEAVLAWRGLLLQSVGVHKGATCWATPDRVWKATQYRPGDTWHARMRVGAERFHGHGKTAIDALEAARDEARAVRLAISRGLP